MARRAYTPKGTSAQDSASLQALIRLSSASLPVGGYSYSQGLESAVNDGRVTNLVGLKMASKRSGSLAQK